VEELEKKSEKREGTVRETYRRRTEVLGER